MTTMSLTPVNSLATSSMKSVARQSISLRQRRRLARTIFSLSLMVVIGAGFSAVSSASDSHTNNGTQGFVKIVVGNGQSLWNIASIINKNNPTEVVDEIVSQNNLSGADVTTGQAIWVPAK
jgi:hypothetical protein